MSKFKVGDKARTSRENAIRGALGLFGIGGDWDEETIFTIAQVYEWATVESTYQMAGSSLYYPESALVRAESAPREFIVIRRDGNKTIAELRHGREVVKSAEARCAPTDTFDFFNEGAPRAFDRLMGREEPKPQCKPEHRDKCTWRREKDLSPAPEPKYYAGKVVCTGYYYGYEWAFRDIVGRILIIENGKCINQDLTGQRIESFAPLCSILNKATWMEVKD